MLVEEGKLAKNLLVEKREAELRNKQQEVTDARDNLDRNIQIL